MIRTHLQVRKFLHLDLPCIVAKNDYIQGVFRIAGGDQFAKRHGHFLSGRYTVLAIEDHRVRDIDYEHCGSLGFKVGFKYLQVVLLHVDLLDTMIDERVPEASCEVYSLQRIAKFVWACLRIDLITLAAFEGVMIT